VYAVTATARRPPALVKSDPIAGFLFFCNDLGEASFEEGLGGSSSGHASFPPDDMNPWTPTGLSFTLFNFRGQARGAGAVSGCGVTQNHSDGN